MVWRILAANEEQTDQFFSIGFRSPRGSRVGVGVRLENASPHWY
jgi:hypothetical protein